MGGEPIPRAFIGSSQCRTIDSQLKSLKLITHRFQSPLTLHETELKILQRLIYRNSNQHRSALFWRNVAELHRYSERLGNLRFLDKIQSLRYTFHGSDGSSKISMKGPWTHLPSGKCLLDISKSLQILKSLTRKMSEACSRAYASFHRSLQSGAFLTLLLTLVAISSRLSMVSSELKEACEQADACISRFLILHEHLDKQDTVGQSTDKPVELSSTTSIPNQHLEQIAKPEMPPSRSSPPMETEYQAKSSAECTVHLIGHHAAPKILSATVIVERHVSSKVVKRPMGNKPTMDQPAKKKRKTRNEIDHIFGS